MLCYRCGSHVPDGTEQCGTCGQKFALGLKPGPIAGFGTGTRRHRIAVESSPYKVGDVLADRYEIRDNVGAGPVGWVFKCLDRDIDVDVAVKVISPRFVQAPEERQALLRELRQARKLSHPNIVRVYEDGEDRERVFFTMQHLEGLTLRRIWDLRRQKGQLFALREVEPIIAQVAQALDAAHGTMSHGDLKPDNVIVLPDLLKITDFGLANALPRGPFMAAQKTGGVHRYLAPEFLHGERIDPRGDVFSLGVILGEMLAGAPFEGQGFDLLARNPALPKEIEQVFRKAVSFKPEERFGTPQELALAVAEATGGNAAARLKQAAQSAPGLTPIDRPRPQVHDTPAETPRVQAPKAPTPVQAPKAPTPVAQRSVPPPPKAGDIAQRENTEEVGEEAIEEADDSVIEEAEAAPSLKLPKKELRDEITDPRAVQIAPVEAALQKEKPQAPAAPTPGKKQEPAKSEPPKKQEAAKSEAPKKQEAAKNEAPKKQEPAKTEPPKKQAEAKKPEQQKTEPPKSKDAKKPESKGEPAWSKGGGQSVPPPPKTPAAPPPPQKSDRVPLYAAGALVVLIIALVVYFGMKDDDAKLKKPAPALPAVAEVEKPAALPDAGPPGAAEVAATDPAKAAPAEELKKDEKKADPKVAEARADAKAVKDAAAAEKKQKAEEAAAEKKRLAEEAAAEKKQKAEEAAAEKKRLQDEALKRLAEAADKKKAEDDAKRAEAEKKKAEEDAKKSQVKTASFEAGGSPAGGSCPGGMRLIPAGTFKFGAPDSDDLKNFGDLDVEERQVPAYCIDILEFPNKSGVKPAVAVSWKQAADQCKTQKKRLCREDEWERACKGPSNMRFPYGKNFDPNACNTADGEKKPRDLANAGANSKCLSYFGVYDLAGNVAEWTDSLFEDGGSERVAKGGAADRPDYDTRCAARTKKGPGTKDRLLGFRCCADAK